MNTMSTTPAPVPFRRAAAGSGHPGLQGERPHRGDREWQANISDS